MPTTPKVLMRAKGVPTCQESSLALKFSSLRAVTKGSPGWGLFDLSKIVRGGTYPNVKGSHEICSGRDKYTIYSQRRRLSGNIRS